MSNRQFQLGDFCVDEARPIKVVIIGAGYSGIITGIRLQQKVKHVDLTIYESQCGVGGVWFANRYPGLACDIPSHSYQLTFESNKKWSAFYAPGPEICQYLQGVADKYRLGPYIKLQHQVVAARYDEASGKWHMSIRRPISGKEGETEDIEDTADILITGVGNLSRWKWPDIQGLETFQGELIHSADWKTSEGEGAWQDTVKTWGEKRVGVIGVGSSAIQLVATLQPRVKHLVNYVRGKTWISSTFAKDKLMQLANGKEVSNYDFTEEDWKRFEDDKYYQEYRHKLEAGINVAHAVTLLDHPIHKFVHEEIVKDMVQRLAKKPWIADYIIPNYAVACRRLTPGPGYLEALCEDNCDFMPTHIKQITSDGIETVDGKHQALDVIICATGFDTSGRYEFPVTGRNGVDLSDKYTPYPRSYLGVAVDGFPNFFHVFGPHSAVGAGSLLLLIERQASYVVEAVLKIQRERLKSMEPKIEAVNDFDEYMASYFPKTVFGQKCRSWYKVGKSEDGRVVSLWPGSSLHAAKTFQHPRWEDFNYEKLDGDAKNRFYFLGDGNTTADKDPNEDKAWYLRPENIDSPPVPN